jgi:hypothetical protein
MEILGRILSERADRFIAVPLLLWVIESHDPMDWINGTPISIDAQSPNRVSSRRSSGNVIWPEVNS